MHISQKLFQFNRKSLVVVAGRRAADFYQAFNGEINKVDSVKMEVPKDSDSEGVLMRLGKGKLFRARTVLEDKSEEIDRKFIREVKEKTQDLFERNQIEEIYLFASNYVKKNLPGALLNNIGQKIVLIIEGNYLKNHPFSLIKKIEKKQEGRKIKFISETAMKILGKRKNR